MKFFLDIVDIINYQWNKKEKKIKSSKIDF